ncbi:histidinol dehydrogenase [Dictyoglomus thermophilum]|uniref:Histidinol dehydrogenase n=1 Tax=Dictyoglomus thermophilum (strain ATCC 35947 / DSM 3960 / H-6-12) TaxID=309799 RepID=B5YE85_DICT6|nr:histidinol dehydrogenase [Dictyoglomus thermophilum]ACI19697.1 histidinol dehydrogenase [Dictyoglomus thermophilum H-6-12]
MINVIRGKDFDPNFLRIEDSKIKEIEKNVEFIIEEVKTKGDLALYDFSLRYDNYDSRKYGFKINVPDIDLSTDFAVAIKVMIERVKNYYMHEYKNSWFYKDGESIFGQLVVPVDSVLLYVPGGRASYPSTVVMGLVPAIIAGVKNLYVTTPPSKRDDKNLLYTLRILGIKELYLLGGAHAISAFAYGTESIPKVDMIIGPGNLYVALAKKKVFGDVNIDGIFGPSEVLVWVNYDKDLNLRKVVCDFLAQLEHSPYDRGWIIVSENLVYDLLELIKKEVEDSERGDILKESLKNSFLIIEENEKNAINLINQIGPEHLEIIDPFGERYIPYIKNAGAIFINHSSIFGDFIAGPSHILPTGGSAKFSSGLSVNSFLKRISFVKLSTQDQKILAKYGSTIAREEGFYMHEKSLRNYGEE